MISVVCKPHLRPVRKTENDFTSLLSYSVACNGKQLKEVLTVVVKLQFLHPFQKYFSQDSRRLIMIS